MAEEHGEALTQNTLHSKGETVNNASRQYKRLVGKFGLSLNIPTSSFIHSEGPSCVTLPYLKPTDLLGVLLRSYPWLFFGGCDKPVATDLLQSFWDAYKLEHGDHPIFKNEKERLKYTFPVTVHGDGGRTQKKQPLEIFSLQPVIGLNTAAGRSSTRCHCDECVVYGGSDFATPLTHLLNNKHNSLLTHFLIFAYPSKKYSKDFPNLLDGLMETVLSNLGEACEAGIDVNGTLYFPACIGFKLDMEWMAKVGSLTRSYQNVGTVRSLPCCHECDAGLSQYPFEDVNPNAKWLQTRWRTIPWVKEPPWRKVPFDSSKPAKFLRRDPFHIFRLGISRNFLASCIFLLCYMG